MKYLSIFLLLVLMSIAIKAQDMDAQKKSVSLRILDKKERPMNNIFVRSFNTTNAGFTDRSGLFVFADMSDNDTISVTLPKSEVIIPVVEMDSIVVKLRSARRYYYVSNVGQSEILNTTKTESTDFLDVQEMLKKHSYRSLAEILQGVAGLNFSTDPTNGYNTNINIRGPISINGSNEPLIVLDGVMLGSFATAENLINIYDIKTIEVQKNATQWGAFGANGAIVIKTK